MGTSPAECITHIDCFNQLFDTNIINLLYRNKALRGMMKYTKSDYVIKWRYKWAPTRWPASDAGWLGIPGHVLSVREVRGSKLGGNYSFALPQLGGREARNEKVFGLIITLPNNYTMNMKVKNTARADLAVDYRLGVYVAIIA